MFSTAYPEHLERIGTALNLLAGRSDSIDFYMLLQSIMHVYRDEQATRYAILVLMWNTAASGTGTDEELACW